MNREVVATTLVAFALSSLLTGKSSICDFLHDTGKSGFALAPRLSVRLEIHSKRGRDGAYAESVGAALRS